MIKVLNIYLLSSEWEFSHRKSFVANIDNKLGRTLVIQFPLSLTINLFLKFRKRFIGFIFGKYKPFYVDQKIEVITPVIIFHLKYWSKCKLIAYLDSKLMAYQINNYINKKYPDCKINLWIYTPAHFYLMKHINYDNLIYDYYDDTEYNNFGDKNQINIDLNKELVPKCDLVICISEFTTNRMLQLNKRSIRTVSGYNPLLFKSDMNIHKSDIDKLKKPIIGYTGVLRDYNDFEILKYILEKSDNYLVCIGYIDRSFKNEYNLLKNYNNFIHIDYKPIQEIPYYINKFDVGILPYKINNFTKSVFPLKFFEYMASGIPIVSSTLPELRKYEGIIGYSKSKEDFLENCIKAINGFYDEKIKEYYEILNNNSWDKIFDLIHMNIAEIYKKKNINFNITDNN